MEWWQIIIPAVIGWLLGIGTIYLREKIAENSTRKRIIKLLVAEIESNQYILEKIKELKESTRWEEIRDLEPTFAPFQKLAYLSLTDKLGVLDASMMIKIQRYYSLIGMLEHNQSMISQSPDHPVELRRTFAEAYYATGSQAANVGNGLLHSFYRAVPSMLAAKWPFKGSVRAVYDSPRHDETKDEGQ